MARTIDTIKSEHQKIIASAHNAVVGHHGVSATLRLLLENNHQWPRMRSDVVKFIHQCYLSEIQNYSP